MWYFKSRKKNIQLHHKIQISTIVHKEVLRSGITEYYSDWIAFYTIYSCILGPNEVEAPMLKSCNYRCVIFVSCKTDYITSWLFAKLDTREKNGNISIWLIYTVRALRGCRYNVASYSVGRERNWNKSRNMKLRFNDGDRENNGNDQSYVKIALFITLNTPYTVVPHKWTKTWC